MASTKMTFGFDPRKKTFFVVLPDALFRKAAERAQYSVVTIDGQGVVYPQDPKSRREVGTIMRSVNAARGQILAERRSSDAGG